MSIDLETIVVGVIVTAALGYLVRAAWRSWRGRKAGCGGGCACAAKNPVQGTADVPHLIPSESLTLRQKTPNNN
jgi:hypothetical protein